jgi:tyrosyl-tRNA synthetase
MIFRLSTGILTYMSTMTLSEELLWRGQVKDKTFDDINWLNEPKTFYLGADCQSADSLTIGNLAIYMLARRLRKHGWKAVMLVGGATSLIGDPGGKDEERQLKTREEIQANVAGIRAQVAKLFDGMDFVPVDNYDWFKDIGYLEFLRDVGKHYSMTELVQRDFIATRMGEGGSGISYAEFSYSLIQGYDFWHLFKTEGTVLQIGGSDQWGNMLSGVPLVRKKENAEVHALSIPLVIDKSTGKKFGKSEAGAIWLDPNKTSVYQFYQFWLNMDDAGVEDYLKIYTERNKDDIDAVMAEFIANKAGRIAQKTLAYEVTKIVHGEKRADSVKRVTEVLFGGSDYATLTADDFAELQNELPFSEAADQVDVVACLTDSGLASSKTEARRFVQDGAVYINGQAMTSETTHITSDQAIHGFVVIRRGKNTQALIRFQ